MFCFVFFGGGVLVIVLLLFLLVVVVFLSVVYHTSDRTKNNPVHVCSLQRDLVFLPLFVCCLLNVLVTCKWISGTDLLRQLYVLPHTEVADQALYLTQSQYTGTGPTSASAGPITPGAWQGSLLEYQFLSHWYDSTQKNPHGASGNRTPDLPLSRRSP